MSFFSSLETYLEAVTEGKVAEVALNNRQIDDEACKLVARAISATAVPRVLDLQSNAITVYGLRILCEALLAHPSVFEVSLDNNRLDDEAGEAILELLHANSRLRAVSVQSNALTLGMMDRIKFAAQLNTQPAELKRMVPLLLANDESAIELNLSGAVGVSFPLLKSVLLANRTLRRLDVGTVGAMDGGCVNIADVLKSATTVIEVLDLSSNGITIHGVKLLMEALKVNKSIKTIILRSNKVGDDSVRLMVEALRFNDSITTLDVADNAVTMQYQDALQHALDLNKQTQDLKRAYYAIQGNELACTEILFQWTPGMELSAKFLAPVLKANTVVHTVNLSNARIGDAGAISLAMVLKYNKTIVVLHLANDDITSTGAAPIAQSLVTNTTLRELNLANNRICEVAAQELSCMLLVNHTLLLLNVELNDIPPLLMDSIEGLVTVNQQPRGLKTILPQVQADSDKLTLIDFSQYDGVQYHSDASVAVLCKALRLNTHVRHIDLSFNCIGDAGALRFAEVLATNHSIEVLTLSECSIGDRGGEGLARSLVTNTTLQELDLEGNCVGDATAAVFVEVLVVNHYVSTLNVDRTRVTPPLVNDIRIACAINLQPQSLKLLIPRLRTRDPTGTDLDLSIFDGHRQYNDQAVAILCFELANNDIVRSLNLSCNAFAAEGMKCLGDYLAQPYCRVEKLVLVNGGLTDESIAVLASAIKRNQTLLTVDLSENKFTTAGVQLLVEALDVNDTITTLTVTKTKEVSSASLAKLNRSLVINTQPIALKRVLPAILANDPAMSHVDLRGAGASSLFGDTAAQLLALALAKNTTVISVDISDNDVTSLGAEYFADMLEDNRTLQCLVLTNNRIDDAGAQFFVRVVGVNDFLRVLDLNGNPISQATADELDYVMRINNGPMVLKKNMIALAKNSPEIVTLDFAFRGEAGTTPFTDDYVHVLCSLLVDNTYVKTLYLERNHIGDRGAQLLADTLRVNSTITELWLDENPIGGDGGHALFLALKTNHTLVHLGLTGTRIPPTVMEMLNTTLVINKVPLREPVRPKGAFKSRPHVASLTNDGTFRDVDYLRDVSDQIFDDAMQDCPAKFRGATSPPRIGA